jgi:hypothetical protein
MIRKPGDDRRSVVTFGDGINGIAIRDRDRGTKIDTTRATSIRPPSSGLAPARGGLG